MTTLIPIYLEPATFQSFQRLVVLAGSENAAVERLINYWETSMSSHARPHGQQPARAERPAVEVWQSKSGDTFPIGARFEATDNGETHFATVRRDGIHYEGKSYESPSAAARAVKEKRGLHGASASTNGREFWKIRDPRSGVLVPLSALRPDPRVDIHALLAEIDALPSDNAEDGP